MVTSEFENHYKVVLISWYLNEFDVVKLTPLVNWWGKASLGNEDIRLLIAEFIPPCFISLVYLIQLKLNMLTFDRNKLIVL